MMYEKLKELAERLDAEGKKDDSCLVFSAMIHFAPNPKPKFEKISNPVPGHFLHIVGY
jgi:hypothetical protein